MMEVEEPSVSNPSKSVNNNESNDPSAAMSNALKKVRVAKKAIAKSSLKFLQKTVQNIQKNPSQKNRRLKLNNILVKKFVTDVEGALDFLCAIGFETNGDVLEIPQTKIIPEVLKEADNILTSEIDALQAASLAPAAPKERKQCKCGFWGDPKTEDLCSLCYRKQYFGVGATAQEEEEGKKCIKECGSFGAARFGGMCSVCHGKAKGNAPHWRLRFNRAVIKLRALHRFRLVLNRPVQKNKKRCWVCKRKLGILGYDCRCGYVFCSEHRYTNMHDCSFDHKRAHRNKLIKDNPTVDRAKMKDRL